MKNIVVISCLCLIIFSCKYQPCEYNQIAGFAQGTSYSIIYENCKGKDYRTAIDSILEDFDKSLSQYKQGSIISRINANEQKVKIDEHFKTVFIKSKQIWEQSDGCMDITVGPIINAMGFGSTKRTIIDSAKIKNLLKYVGFEKVILVNNEIIKSDTAVKLDVNSIAQGYSVDVVSEFFEEEGIDNFLVEIGGEIRTKGKNPENEYWRIGIDKPEEGNMTPGEKLQEIVFLKNKSLSTSGNYRKYYEENGVKYTHIISPKTGFPVKSQLLSVTIVAKDCITADGWDTAFMVMGLEKSKEVLKKHPELEAYMIYSDNNGNMQVYMTDGFKYLLSE